jgi:hypothetical protein
MKIFRVIDDGICILTTADELTALRLLQKIMDKHDVTVGWVDAEDVK